MTSKLKMYLRSSIQMKNHNDFFFFFADLIQIRENMHKGKFKQVQLIPLNYWSDGRIHLQQMLPFCSYFTHSREADFVQNRELCKCSEGREGLVLLAQHWDQTLKCLLTYILPSSNETYKCGEKETKSLFLSGISGLLFTHYGVHKLDLHPHPLSDVAVRETIPNEFQVNIRT